MTKLCSSYASLQFQPDYIASKYDYFRDTSPVSDTLSLQKLLESIPPTSMAGYFTEWCAERRAILDRYTQIRKVLTAIFASFVTGCAIGSIALEKAEPAIGIAIGAVVFAQLLYFAHNRRKERYRDLGNDLKQQLMGKLDIDYQPEPQQFFLDHYREYSLTPALAKSELFDRIDIQEDELTFSYARLYAYRQLDRSFKLPAFSGFLMKVHLDREIYGKVLINQKKNEKYLPTKSKAGLTKIQLGDPLIDETFDVFASDYSTAFALMQPGFIGQLEKARDLFNASDINAIYAHGTALIAVESMERPLDISHLVEMGAPKEILEKLADDTDRLRQLAEFLKP